MSFPTTKRTPKNKKQKFIKPNSSSMIDEAELQVKTGDPTTSQSPNDNKMIDEQLPNFTNFVIRIKRLTLPESQLDEKSCGIQSSSAPQRDQSNVLFLPLALNLPTSPPPLRRPTFTMFALARHQNSEGIIDLSYCSLKELVEILKVEQIINMKTYNRFIMHYLEKVEKYFVRACREGNSFGNLKYQIFALIDHRFFTRVLCLRNPDKYIFTLNSPVSFDTQVTEYFESLYEMSIVAYDEALGAFNEKHERFWMPKTILAIPRQLTLIAVTSQNQELHLTNRYGRALRYRAETDH